MAYLLAFAIGAWLLYVTWCGVVPGGITVWGKSEAGQKMRPGQRILFGVGGILIFGLGILLFLFRYQESYYSTLADADKVGAITRGWIPDDILPSNSRNIHEVHNPSSPSTEWCSFEFPPADSEILRRRLKSIDVLPISVRFVPIPGGAWWPSVLTGNLEVEKIHKSGLELYIVEKPETSVTTEILLFAIDWPKGRGFFYRTRESAPVPGVPVAARSPKPIKDVYSVEDLVANPQDFAHTMVKVSGCFWSDVGHVTDNAVSLLQQCGRAWSTPSVQRDYKDFYDQCDFGRRC